MADKKQQDIDLTIFKSQKSDIECDENNENPTQSCSAIKRLIIGLKYYSLLNVITNEDHKQIFISFIKSVYTKFLDDYNHLIGRHDKQLEKINKSLIQDASFGDCKISKCQFATRHHKERQNNNDDNNNFDGQFEFYKTTMDSLHFYLLHLFHVGLRAIKNKINEEQQEEEVKQEGDQVESLDKEFSRIVKAITDRRHISDSFDRFKSDGKFNISVAAESGK